MSNKMLIDATHPEETRVVVLRGNRVEEFDFEAADRQQLRGNIYLAKVTRVEPSLQAAFVEYGGNRHGFLAFSEIHPDYYQIPYADRKALLEEHAAEAAEEARQEDRRDAQAEASEPVSEQERIAAAPTVSEAGSDAVPAEENGAPATDENGPATAEAPAPVENVGAEDALEEVPERRKPRPRQYKIQEVIKRRQVLLVQVVKEERGSKGAALTTYLSLAGRYSVLMPNTARGGGISRKITNAVDRKRLKSVASELEVPEGMGVILRTAGANRTKAEIKRDFEYLLRLWENVRELTLRSTAPKLVYEEGSLIKRSIRDLYSREIDQVLVAGDEAYREAKDFMRMLMPSHARHVQPYRDETPIFSRNGVEPQLDAMFSPQVTLRSGGYIVINQTEALVAIDVNSGRSTREHSIEDTALNTNLEAAEEVARQLRLRDLAGLIVIDFIDMEENRNNRSVERKLKDCLRLDRARIQLGRISHFGLMEMSRQRIRTGVLESSTVPCPHCRGTGQVRSIASLSLQILRALEDHLLRHSGHHLHVRARPEVALYVLNQKRQHLAQLENRFGLTITIEAEAPHDGAGYIIERGEPVLEGAQPRSSAIARMDMADEPESEEPAEVRDAEPETAQPSRRPERPDYAGRSERAENGDIGNDEEGRDKRRRRRRRRGNGDDRPEQERLRARFRDDERPAADDSVAQDEAADDAREPADRETSARNAAEESAEEGRRRRRGRRGGRRRGRGRDQAEANGEFRGPGSADAEAGEDGPGDEEFGPGDPGATEAGADMAWEAAPDPASPLFPETPVPLAAGPETVAPNELTGDAHAEEVEALTEAMQEEPDQEPAAPEPLEPREAREPEPAHAGAEAPDDGRPKRTGWWNRRSFF